MRRAAPATKTKAPSTPLEEAEEKGRGLAKEPGQPQDGRLEEEGQEETPAVPHPPQEGVAQEGP
jgi:hypothetical protein